MNNVLRLGRVENLQEEEERSSVDEEGGDEAVVMNRGGELWSLD